MKKVLLVMFAIFLVCGLNAQTMRVYENGRVVYKSSTADSVVFVKTTVEGGQVNGHEWVDLGLSVKWATCNVGATKPEGYGDYFAWGEIYPKTDYSEATYEHMCCRSADDCNSDSCYGSTTLALWDDAAYMNWGDSWRMPTASDLEELCDSTKCIWEKTNIDTIVGYQVTSRINGNSIFLPAAGCMAGTSVYDVGLSAYYYSNIASYPSYPYLVASLYCDETFNMGQGAVLVWMGLGGYFYGEGFVGTPIRPVCK